eukprot:TRINITY_DN52000_c0_g1_i1.p1 TRINITY_DN52000_c0_g1~~TRINITY_DN52000_c0_g1_i1.p1  ORF type:complete len:106 (-),score=0.69 TRINITY_DN52000_c0_g1_i1:105-422(-)
MIRRPPRSTLSSSSAASDVYKRQVSTQSTGDSNISPSRVGYLYFCPSYLQTACGMCFCCGAFFAPQYSHPSQCSLPCFCCPVLTPLTTHVLLLKNTCSYCEVDTN